jgi:prepilin-type N-terminal cleavage/methylation domain-containing protein
MHPITLRQRRRSAFSLIELVVVLVILGVIAAIAIPRMTRGATNAGGVALKSSLQTLRGAIELYRSEHNGLLPTADIGEQLTKFTDANGGNPSDTMNAAMGIIYGPYLMELPPLPVGSKKGNRLIETADGAGVGWLYDPTTGVITANTSDTEVDPDGVKYNTY